MDMIAQKRAPIYEALERFRKMRIVPFDVPGHKHGRGNPELVELLGSKCVGIDVNSMKPLDNLCHPVSVMQRSRGIGSRSIRGGPCIFDGGRDHVGSTEHGTVLL